MRAYAMAQRPLSVRRQLFPLNDFFSRTTRPISTKLIKLIYRKMLKKSFSQELLGQFQLNLAENMPGDGDSDLF